MKLTFLILSILFCLETFGQKSDSSINESDLFSRKNSINLEAFGHGLFYSFYYERIIVNKLNYKLSGQIGCAAYPYPDQIDLWIPVSVNFIKTIGIKHRNHAEIGIGHVARYDQLYHDGVRDPWQMFFTAKAGYRYQKPNGRWIFKILFTPFFEYDRKKLNETEFKFKNILTGDNPYPSGALSIGYCF